MSTHRPAARVVCLDAAGRILLLHWRDPYDGVRLWEPPGGGLEPDESPLAAARREVAEETGLDPSMVVGPSVPVHRDFTWRGTHYCGVEQFFLARYPVERPPLSRAALLPDEREVLLGHDWVLPADLHALTDRLEPPQLLQILTALC